jgi:peroxiredoxin
MSMSTPTPYSPSLTVNTDLLAYPSIVLQKARPFHTDGVSSNLAVDNVLSMTSLFGTAEQGKKVAVFGVPAPFTGTCTNAHVPGYTALTSEFKAAGVSSIICLSVACPYAHYNWSKGMKGVPESGIEFVADDLGHFMTAFGLEKDCTAASLGTRSVRFSMIVVGGKVTAFNLVGADAENDAKVLLSQV